MTNDEAVDSSSAEETVERKERTEDPVTAREAAELELMEAGESEEGGSVGDGGG